MILSIFKIALSSNHYTNETIIHQMADAACLEENKSEDRPENLTQTTSNTTDQNSVSIDSFLKKT